MRVYIKVLIYKFFLVLLVPLVITSNQCLASELVHESSHSVQLMRFPLFTVDGIRYEALQAAYAVEGRLEVTDVSLESETMVCGGSTQESSYLRVDHSGPEILFQISDTRSKKVLYREYLDTAKQTEFGRASCRSGADIMQRFEQQKVAWSQSLEQKIIDHSVQKMESYLADDSILQLEVFELTLFEFLNDQRFAELNSAFDTTTAVFRDYNQFGPTVDGERQLRGGVKIWAAYLKELSEEKNPMPDAKRVQVALHRNLVAAYLVLGNYDLARRHDAMALSLGMPSEETLQPLILEYEKRRILSPKVAGDMVLAANLARFGGNAIRNIQLQQMKNKAELEAM